MKTILDAISEALPQKDVKFLFPSEVAADFWRRRILEEPGVRAIAVDRFLSWDQFKEKLFAMNLQETPVNNRVRRFYSEELLARVAGGDFVFSRLIPPEHRSTAGVFQSALSSLLPHLRGFFQSLGERLDRLDPAYRGDLLSLYEDYAHFLERFSLYEPRWEKPVMGQDGWRYRFFLSELVEDLPDFFPQLKAAPKMELIPLNTLLSGEEASLALYPTALEEVEILCRRLCSLLEGGAEPEEIALTLADKSLLPILERTAGRLDLPLNLRIGKPLGEYPAGRFFGYLKECRDGLFSLESLRTLLLHRGYPWKDRGIAEELIRFGAENYCLRNLGDRPGEDLWQTMLSLRMRDEGIEKLRSYYRALKGAILKLTDAKTFEALDRALEGFLRQFLDTDHWESGGLKVFQRVRTALRELRTLEKRLAGFSTASPLAFLIQDISSGIYVPQREEDRGPGIAVYPYRVSAGIHPRYHVLAGLSQRAADVQFPPFPFLREDQRALLELADRDLSEPFLKVYLRSGGTISASCAGETSEGAQLAPGFLLARGGVMPVEDGPEEALREDPYKAEQAYWREAREILPRGLFSFQKEGAAAAMEFLGSPRAGANLLRNPLPMEPPLRERFVDDEGLVRASAYRMDCWKDCPSTFLFRYGWQLEAPVVEASWEDPREAGRLRHRLCQRVFAEIGDAPFPEDPSDFCRTAQAVAEEVFRLWEVREPFGRTPFWGVTRRRVEAELEELLKREAVQFPGFVVQELEGNHRIPRPAEGLAYSGVIDRVSRRGEALGVVDYKSSFHHPLKSLLSAQGEAFSFQMPLYILFLGEDEGRVEQAVYYNFAKGKFIPFLKPGQEDLREQLLTVLEKEARAYAEEALSGRFCPPEDCDGCNYRSLCRQKYFIKGDALGWR